MYEEGQPLNSFMLPVGRTCRGAYGRGVRGERVRAVAECAMGVFLEGGTVDCREVLADVTDTGSDVQIMRLTAVLALYALSRIDAVTLLDTLLDICRRIGERRMTYRNQ